MPDALTPTNAVRLSPGGSGLPILSTEPLTHAERQTLYATARLFRLVADLVDDALSADLVTRALDAALRGQEAGDKAAALAALLGRGR